MFSTPCHIVLMGVSGCGKSTVGQALSRVTRLTYLDGDDLHPASNIAKMAAGQPLDDADRAPWLAACGTRLSQAPEGLILGCSSLKRSYRDLIRSRAAPARPVFVYLHGSRATLKARMAGRQGHFMPESLLDSQLATLEIPQPPEVSLTVDIDQSTDQITTEILRHLPQMV